MKICGYIPYSSQEIEATITELEGKMVSSLLKGARQDLVGNSKSATNYFLEGEVGALKIHTMENICPTQYNGFVNERATLACGGKGIGNWTIGKQNAKGCEVFYINGALPVTTPPPYGMFSYCSFQTNNFSPVTGGTPPSCT